MASLASFISKSAASQHSRSFEWLSSSDSLLRAGKVTTLSSSSSREGAAARRPRLATSTASRMLRPVRLGLLLLLSLGASLSLYVLLSSSRLDSLANPARYGYPPPARNSSSSGTSAAQHSSSSDDDDEGDLSAHAMLTRVHRALKRATLRSIASHTSALAHGGNALSCPVSQLQSNKDQLRGDGARWARYSPEFLERKRAQVLGATWDTLVQQVSTAAAAANDDDEDDEKAERVEVAARFDDEQQVKKVVDEARQVGEGWMTAQRTFERGSRGIVATAGKCVPSLLPLTYLPLLWEISSRRGALTSAHAVA